VVTAVLAVLVVATLLGRREVAGGALQRLRALIPAWRFFDRATAAPYLLIRCAAPGERLGDWTPIDPGPRGGASWAFAPRANLALAYQAAIEQLVAELGEIEIAAPSAADEIETDPAIVNRVSYELVSRIARGHVPAALRGVAGAMFQWKVVVPAGPGSVDEPDDALVSLELAA
jgi:hypothetical protein